MNPVVRFHWEASSTNGATASCRIIVQLRMEDWRKCKLVAWCPREWVVPYSSSRGHQGQRKAKKASMESCGSYWWGCLTCKRGFSCCAERNFRSCTKHNRKDITPLGAVHLQSDMENVNSFTRADIFQSKVLPGSTWIAPKWKLRQNSEWCK